MVVVMGDNTDANHGNHDDGDGGEWNDVAEKSNMTSLSIKWEMSHLFHLFYAVSFYAIIGGRQCHQLEVSDRTITGPMPIQC